MIIRLVILQFALFVCLLLSAQTILFQRSDDNCRRWYPTTIYSDNYVLYNNSSNYYTIVAEGIMCDDLIITVDSGLVYKNGCKFNIQPNVKNAKFDFNIYVKSSLVIDTNQWLVVDPPPINITVKGIIYQHQSYISTKLDSVVSEACHKTEAASIDSFSFVWTRGDSVILTQVILSNQFPDSISKRFQLYGRKDDIISIPHLWYSRNNKKYYLERSWQHQMLRSPFR